MPNGIAGFRGERLRQARALRGLVYMSSLANLAGISKQMISRYESGDARPTEEIVQKLASTLNLPVEFFFRELRRGADSPILFRSMKQALKAERQRAQEILELGSEAIELIDEYIDMPELTLPRLNRAGTVQVLTNQYIEGAARKTRDVFGYPSGPLPNLVILAERSGVITIRTELAERELDGLSRWDDLRPLVVINSTKSPARSRFDLAHEIGHLVLHSFVPKEMLESKSVYDAMEKQAHRFAGALLLPAEEFGNDLWLFTLDELLAIKPKWQVSIQSMVQRAWDLDLISDEDRLRMIKQISARKWRTQEPLEAVVHTEVPSLLRDSLEMIVQEVPEGSDTIRKQLPFGNLLAEVVTAPPGFLTNDAMPRIVDLRSYRRST